MSQSEQIRTSTKKARVLSALAESLGTVAVACRAAGVARTAFYSWIRRDPAFAARVNEIEEIVTCEAEAELYRRAVTGWREPIFHNGKICGEVLKKSDTCLIFLLKARRPERYVQAQQIRGEITMPTFIISPEMDDSRAQEPEGSPDV